MPKEFNGVVERDSEGYFVASVPALPGCHTQARSMDELMSRVCEAIAVHLEDCSVEVSNTRGQTP